MTFLHILLNLGLLMTLLIAPSLALLAHWYRRQMPPALLWWKRPEMVLVSIFCAVSALVLLIVGLSCLFIRSGYWEATHPRIGSVEMYDALAGLCAMGIIVLGTLYWSLRKVLVQLITRAGIVFNDRVTRLPDMRRILPWGDITDYFVQDDFPNKIFTLLCRNPHGIHLRRIHLRVPRYQAETFEQFIESFLNGNGIPQQKPEIPRQRFSAN